MEEEIIKEAESILENILEKAKKQLDVFRQEKNSQTRTILSGGKKYLQLNGILMPYETGVARIKASPDTFLYSVIEIFWELYDLISKDIRNPLIQFSMRPLLELCYGKIIYLALQKGEKQRDVATKAWLCTDGLTVAGRPGTVTDYDNLIKELSEKRDQEYFKEIQKKGFPREEIFKKIKSIFPPIRHGDVMKQIEPYLLEIWGKKLDKDYLSGLYLWLCQYVHPNTFLLRNLKKERENKSHIMRCSVVLFVTGYHLLNFVDKNILKQGDDLSDFKNNISEVLSKLKKV